MIILQKNKYGQPQITFSLKHGYLKPVVFCKCSLISPTAEAEYAKSVLFALKCFRCLKGQYNTCGTQMFLL